MDATDLLAESMASDADQALERWAACGGMALTGRADGPPDASPARVALAMDALAAHLGEVSARLGRRVTVPGADLLGERAAIGGLERRGAVSCGGATHLLAASDGWVAVSLARPTDVELIPAWLELSAADVGAISDELWERIASVTTARRAGDVVERASLLGLPCALLGEAGADGPVVEIARGRPATGAARTAAELVVIDLSSLWAGPLCGHLLGLAGARVIKVESETRPDGARFGPAGFFDLLHAGQESVALDLRVPEGQRQLSALIERADVVIEASRPRALVQMGITPDLQRDSAIWISITGHGRSGPGAARAAFGDDAAVAGGLVGRDGEVPLFCADAIADPATGLLAAAVALDLLDQSASGVIDVSLARTCAHLASGVRANPQVGPGRTVSARAPHARQADGRAPALGEHTNAVLSEFGIPASRHE